MAKLLVALEYSHTYPLSSLRPSVFSILAITFFGVYLNGLVLIACSASYIFIIMQDYWKRHARRLRATKSQTTSEKPRRKDAL